MVAVTVVWLWAGRLTWVLRLPRPRPAASVPDQIEGERGGQQQA